MMSCVGKNWNLAWIGINNAKIPVDKSSMSLVDLMSYVGKIEHLIIQAYQFRMFRRVMNITTTQFFLRLTNSLS